MGAVAGAVVWVGGRFGSLRAGTVGVIVAGVLLVFPAVSLAATYTVNTTADNAPNSTECSGVAGDCSLRQAIAKSNADLTNDTINVPAGDYKLTIAGADETNDATGDLNVNKASGTMTIVGTAGARSTTIDATGLGDRILSVVSGTVTITGFTLTGGAAPPGEEGGGILNSGGTLTLSDSTVTANKTTAGGTANEPEGGGVAQLSSAGETLSGDTITNNTSAQYGGGVDIDDGTSTIVDTTITGNTGPADGGGVDIDTGDVVQFTNDTIAANSAPQGGGGGVWVESTTVQFVNTIVANNTSSSSDTADCVSNNLTDQGHNLDSTGTCFTPTPTNGDINANPKLGPLQNNGGPTDTLALLDGSPAINAGSNSACPATDQRGITRPQPAGGICDIGAYEATAPLVQTEPATAVGTTSATLNGTVNPANLATTYHFEWGTTTAYGHSTATGSAGSAYGSQSESAGISGLAPNTTYHYRIVATNAVATADGADMTFTTKGPPTATTGPATGVTTTGATVTGTVNPDGLATTYLFQYGTSTGYGHSSASTSAGSASSNESVSASLSGLKAKTKYHYRIVATNSAGTTYGADQTFTTATPAFKGAIAPHQSDRMSSSGVVAVRVQCPAGTYGTCSGTLQLVHNGTVIGTASFKIRSGHSAVVRVHLSSHGQTLVGTTGTVHATAVARSHDAAGTRRRRARTITILASAPAPTPPPPHFTG